MSDEDHLIIKRVVRSVLAKTLQLSYEQIEQTAAAVLDTLEHECGGDRLYVRVPRSRPQSDRDARIRMAFEKLTSEHSQRMAFEILARREALSVRQLRRICSDANDSGTTGQSPIQPRRT